MKTAEELATLLGALVEGDATLASILEGEPDPALASAIRASFQPGNEQGNARRLRALVALEGQGALDVLEAVLTDGVTVGGVYSNLRNTALGLIAEHYPGEPRLRAPLLRAIEVDPYLQGDLLGKVLLPYDEARGRALLVEALRWGSPVAIRTLLAMPGERATVIEALDAVIDDVQRAPTFLGSLGPHAQEEDIAARILARADDVPVAAMFAVDRDGSRAPELVKRLHDKAVGWRRAAAHACRHLPPDVVFELASPLFTEPTRATGAARARLESFAWEVRSLDDPRWVRFLSDRLCEEDSAKLRGWIVRALGKAGPGAAAAIIAAPRDDKDRDVLAAIPQAIHAAGGGEATRALIEAAIPAATKKHQKVLQQSLAWVSG